MSTKRKPYTNGNETTFDAETVRKMVREASAAVENAMPTAESRQHVEDALIGGYIRECQAKQPGATTVDLSRLEAIRTGIRLVLA